MLLIAFTAAPAFAANDGGGKKKAKKKAKMESKTAKCEPKDCDPGNCDPKDCDPKCCNYEEGTKTETCKPTQSCAGN